jgi:ferric-dicitrate binding protein FerR (iron transport regulator)
MEQNKNNINWNILAAYVSDNSTAEQKKEVEDWLSASEENRALLSQVQKVWSKAAIKNDEYPDTIKAWENVRARAGLVMNTKILGLPVQGLNAWLKVAAAILVFVGLLILLPNKREKIAQAENRKRIQVILSDGSVIDLNRNSTLKYDAKFSGNTREVTLKGEAYFNITKNPKKPFIIHAGSSEVKVLGTSFNINNYGNESVEVIVNSGIVAFYPGNKKTAQKPVVITKDQKVFYIESTGNITKGLNTDQNYLSWKTGNFIFRQTQLSVVFEKIQTYYGMDITLNDDAINHLKLTATFNKEPADQVMYVLKLTFGLEIEHIGNKYIVGKRDNGKNIP